VNCCLVRTRNARRYLSLLLLLPASKEEIKQMNQLVWEKILPFELHGRIIKYDYYNHCSWTCVLCVCVFESHCGWWMHCVGHLFSWWWLNIGMVW
jgi:hypothetical protein